MLRFVNLYGDPSPWSIQERGGIYTALSFLRVTKSPPSLLFLCVTLGTACILLVLAERVAPRAKKLLATYGRVPFFFFIIHLGVISIASYIWTYVSFGQELISRLCRLKIGRKNIILVYGGLISYGCCSSVYSIFLACGMLITKLKARPGGYPTYKYLLMGKLNYRLLPSDL